nr:hypothetical protein [Tanacetum cinerariifolium]
MISMRIKKFYKRTGKKLQFDTKDPVELKETKTAEEEMLGTMETKLETMEYAQNYAMMAYSSSNSGSDNEVKSCSKACEESYARLKKLYDEQRDKLGDDSVEITAYTLALKKTSENATCKSDSGIETTTSMPAPVEEAPKVVSEPKVWTDAPIIEEYESDSDDDSVSNVQEEKQKPSFAFTNTAKHDDPHKSLKDKGIVNSGCSRHMTGNKAHLADYQEFNDGPVSFGGSNGRIIGKGMIKAG